MAWTSKRSEVGTTLSNNFFFDVPTPWQLSFQDSATDVMQNIVDFHHDIMFIMVFIVIFVTYILFQTIFLFKIDYSKNFFPKVVYFTSANTRLEFIWTVIPAIILLSIAGPSFALLYVIDEISDPIVTLKAAGRQWYWHYEYSTPRISYDEFYVLQDFSLGGYPTKSPIIFDSYLIGDLKGHNAEAWGLWHSMTTYELEPSSVLPYIHNPMKIFMHTHWGRGDVVKSYVNEMIPSIFENKCKYFRLLEVDNQIVLPKYTEIRIFVTSNDVLHSWAVPSLGLKIDACPGRLNSINLYAVRGGIFYGQCSEICGVNHGFMPIVVQIISLEKFLYWYDTVESLHSVDKN